MGGHLIDITGNEYNYLRVLGFSHIHNRESYWRCQCKRCGRIVILRKNNFAYKWSRQKSCGCLHNDLSSARMKELNKNKRSRKNGW